MVPHSNSSQILHSTLCTNFVLSSNQARQNRNIKNSELLLTSEVTKALFYYETFPAQGESRE